MVYNGILKPQKYSLKYLLCINITNIVNTY